LKNETTCQKLEDMLTELDPPYESAEDLNIARLLDQYGIPFFYKQATIVSNQGKNEICKPSFTLPSYGGVVIDYVPNSGQAPKDQILRREQVYRYNQIPAVVLGLKDLDEPHWEQRLYERLKQIYHQVSESMQYGPVDVQK
jgi:hypothetical protein